MLHRRHCGQWPHGRWSAAFHQGLVALLIHGDAALLAQLTGQIDGEAEGIIQAEGILAGEDGLALGGQLFQDGIDLIEAGIMVRAKRSSSTRMVFTI